MGKPETIAAIATAPGRGAVGIVRISGTSLAAMFRPLLGRDDLAPRYAQLCAINDAHGGAIDVGIVLYFPGPSSYTGEDVLELQVHGDIACKDRRVGKEDALQGDFHQRSTKSIENTQYNCNSTKIHEIKTIICDRCRSIRSTTLHSLPLMGG